MLIQHTRTIIYSYHFLDVMNCIHILQYTNKDDNTAQPECTLFQFSILSTLCNIKMEYRISVSWIYKDGISLLKLSSACRTWRCCFLTEVTAQPAVESKSNTYFSVVQSPSLYVHGTYFTVFVVTIVVRAQFYRFSTFSFFINIQ